MYKQWLAKQCLVICGTQSMAAHWDVSHDRKFPDCRRVENTMRLNLCPAEKLTQLWTNMMTHCHKWLYHNYVHPELAYWIPEYIQL